MVTLAQSRAPQVPPRLEPWAQATLGHSKRDGGGFTSTTHLAQRADYLSPAARRRDVYPGPESPAPALVSLSPIGRCQTSCNGNPGSVLAQNTRPLSGSSEAPLPCLSPPGSDPQGQQPAQVAPQDRGSTRDPADGGKGVGEGSKSRAVGGACCCPGRICLCPCLLGTCYVQGRRGCRALGKQVSVSTERGGRSGC